MATFVTGQTIGRGDLDIFLTDGGGNATNAYVITYALYWLDPAAGNAEVLVGNPERVPVNPTVGEYYAALVIPASANLGDYRIRWTIQQYANSPQQQVVQTFDIVAPVVIGASTYTPEERDMINTLRLLLRDQNPDRYYHFRPPEYEGNLNQYNRVFGQIWEDAELYQYLLRSLDWWNMFPPRTAELNTLTKLYVQRPEWRTAIYWGAITHACFALSANWVADEFDYSIGGVSLSLERSSKYETLKQNSEQQFDKASTAKQQTVKFMRGLQQPKYGIGIRSSFGPFVGKGVLSPRGFL